MTRFFFVTLLILISSSVKAETDLQILLLIGSGGTEEYKKTFQETAALWIEAAEKGGAAIQVIGLPDPTGVDVPPPTDTAAQFREAIAAETSPELWVVLLGHGTFDGRTAKFNVPGPDFTDTDLAEWIATYKGNLTLINTASASGSAIRQVSQPGRIVITATKNEGEIFFTRFGKFFAEAVHGDPTADLDNDEQISLLESFLFASKKVEQFYKGDERLATEHALLDDNGDGLGSRAEWFEGTTPTRAPSDTAEPDGDLANQKVLVKNAFERLLTPEQRTRRDGLERQVVELRRSKTSLEEKAYYQQLETALLELARLYDEVKKRSSTQ